MIHRTTSTLASGLLAASIVSYTGHALAQQPKPPPSKFDSDWIEDDDDEPYIPPASVEADQLLKRARELQADNKHPDAILKLREAFSLQQRADIAAELGHSELTVGRYAEAANHLAFAVARLGSSDPLRERSASGLTAARTKVATVYVTLDPSNAQLTVDDGPPLRLGKDEPVHLTPGPHKLVASLQGHESATSDYEATAGATEDVTLILDVEQGPQGKPASYAWAWWLGVGSALTTGTFVAGAVLRVQGDGLLSDADDSLATLGHDQQSNAVCQTAPMVCASIRSDLEDGDVLINASTGLFVAGGALAAGTILGTILLAPGGDDMSSAALPNWFISPEVGPHQLSFHAVGRW